MTNKRVHQVISVAVLILSLVLFQTAVQSDEWRGFIVSEGVIVVTAAILWRLLASKHGRP